MARSIAAALGYSNELQSFKRRPSAFWLFERFFPRTIRVSFLWQLPSNLAYFYLHEYLPRPNIISLFIFFFSISYPLTSFLSSSATALCTSILTIGKLLVHTHCILRTFCSHHIHLATHLSHHQNTLCKITTVFSSCGKSYSHTSQCPLPQLLLHYLLYSTRAYPQHCCERPVTVPPSHLADG